MKQKILSNWGLKLLAFLLAFALWFIVVGIDNPPTERNFSNVQVQLINADVLSDQGKVYEVLEGTDVVKKVTVKGRSKTVTAMKNEGNSSIIATADVRKMSEDGTINIEFNVKSGYAEAVEKVEAAEGAMLKLNVEDKKEKSITVRVSCVGMVKEGYEIGNVKSEQNRITITGPASKIEQVSYGEVEVNVTDSSSDIYTTEAIKLFDKDGAEVDAGRIKKSINSTRIEVYVLATKTVPIEYVPVGEPKSGYRRTDIESDLSEVKIAGAEALINNISSIVVSGDLLDITGASKDVEKEFILRNYLPEGVDVAEDALFTRNIRVKVKVSVEKEIKRTYKVRAGNINITNVPEGWNVITPASYEVYDLMLMGLEKDLNKINEAGLTGSADVTAWMEETGARELEAGTFYIPATIMLPDLVEQLPVDVRVTFEPEEEMGQDEE